MSIAAWKRKGRGDILPASETVFVVIWRENHAVYKETYSEEWSTKTPSEAKAISKYHEAAL